MTNKTIDTELYRFKTINSCESVDQLKSAIKELFKDEHLAGRSEVFSVSEMIFYIDCFVEDYENGRKEYRALPTRKYGIRQQLIYILVNPIRS